MRTQRDDALYALISSFASLLSAPHRHTSRLGGWSLPVVALDGMADSVAIRGAQWVVSKALSPLSDGLVEAWAASSALGPNIEAAKMELLYAQAMLNNARGREIHNPALTELLQKLRGLAYDADDVLDELDYFRIQDELEGTFETVDHGCFHDLVRDAHHTTKAAAKQLECTSCCFSASSKPKHEESCRCMRQLTNRARRTVCSIGKRLLCSSVLPDDDDGSQPWKKGPKTPKLDFDRVNASRRMKHIAEQLQLICAKVSTILDLELLGSAIAKLEFIGSRSGTGGDTTTSRSTTTSKSIEPKLYGRDPEKNTIVENITKGVHYHQDLSVLPIVGPGGIGKTTLTQYIYNSKEVQDHFQIRVWACVSLDFNVYRLSKEILNSIPKVEDEKGDSQIQSLDQLQKFIEKRLKQKRVLVVLDDIWKCSDEEWKRLLIPFTNCQVNGNIILVTTRFFDVAEKVKTKNCKVTQLDGLNPTEFWSFFMACVFGHGESNQMPKESELNSIGHQIVKKLKGSPLAAKTVGRLLRNNPTPDYWTRVLQSKEWDLQTSDYDIMPALKLSYDYLPFHLQQCFSYCALFPEDYKFSNEELIRFWIGLDILHPDHPSKRIEDIGHNYLNQLVNYEFFKKEIDEEHTYYAMHDLLHALALKVSSQECLHIDSSSGTPIEIPPSVYHLSIILSLKNCEEGTIEGSFKKKLAEMGSRLKTENLHTLMIFGQYDESFITIFSDMFKDAKSLRVVHLSTMLHPVESILYSFPKLVHLRYIKLESNYMNGSHLPQSLSRFYHLRVLDIEQWHGACSLPRDMTNLSKLRHFLVPYDDVHSNISNVGKFRCLQQLRLFKVKSQSDGFKLRELGELAELGGSLSICNLEDVQVNIAHEAKLSYKKHLQKLSLNWMDNNRNTDRENQVLEILRPHSNLSGLQIKNGGSTCPTWLGTSLSIKGLKALRLDGVHWKMLPPLGELWLMDGSGHEYFGCTKVQNFRNLKKLKLIGLPNFRRWVAKEVCPMFFLVEDTQVIESESNQQQQVAEEGGAVPSMDHQPQVAEDREDEDGMLLLPSHLCNSLRELSLERCTELLLDVARSALPTSHSEEAGGWGLQPLRSLQRLEISGCPKLFSAYEALACLFPSSLQYLQILGRVEGVQTLDFSNLNFLTRLIISGCGEDLRCEGVWPLLTQGQLSKLNVNGTPRFFAGLDSILKGLQDEQEQQQPLLQRSSKLQELVTKDFTGVLVKPICRLLSSSLTSLYLHSNNEVEHFTKEQEEALQLLTSLQHLVFWCCEKLQRLPAGLRRLESLKTLQIERCPSIRSLPTGGLPGSLQELDVRDCGNEKLKQRCKKLIGTTSNIKLQW
ncbi:putative disease resistance protein RGA4 [Oryza brachyantha]|uniref:putative disease resistance protein RGA4 n=1 Tax=Oryza brachyantha TaxID=4533 RepID=UPI001ADC7720|nr:putative disease resistance protein RGA4 [Oryza brachyantha]